MSDDDKGSWVERLRHWGVTSLRAELLAGFFILIALTDFVGATALWSQRRADMAFDHLIDVDSKVVELSARASTALHKARRAEKDFLLYRSEFGFGEAKGRYVTLVRTNIAEIREIIHEIQELTPDLHIIDRGQSIEQYAAKYQSGFLKVVELYGQLGHAENGLEGTVRRDARRIESLLASTPHGERLMVDLLMLRRLEKNYFTDRRGGDADGFAAGIVRFDAAIAAADPSAVPQKQLHALADAYHRSFSSYVTIEAQIDAEKAGYIAAAHAVEPLIEELYYGTAEDVAATRRHLEATKQATVRTVISSTVAALLLGVGVAGRLSRRIAGGLASCRDFAERVAAGDLTTRLQPTGQREFRTLATALNSMTEALESSHVSLHSRAVELAESNEALRDEILTRERTETELRMIVRARKMMTDCNRVLVHANSERELLEAMCRIAVETGKYRMVWIGYARHDEAKSVAPVAHAGVDADYIMLLRTITWGDVPSGPLGAVIHTGKPRLVKDIRTDSTYLPWRDAALARGVSSVLCLPLRNEAGETFGAISFQSAEPDAFDDAEIELLTELTDDLAYGIGSLRTAAAHRAAEEALRLRNRAIESSVNAIFITNRTDQGNLIEYVNPAFERMTGYTAAEVVGHSPDFPLRDNETPAGTETVRAALLGQRESHTVLRSRRKDGTIVWNELSVAPVKDDGGEITHFVGVLNDITDARNYEAQLEHQANFDTLTGLANRNLLQDRLRQAIATARRSGDPVAVAFLDLDQFKVVNDSLGHTVGDQLLQAVATRLKSCVRDGDTVARVGGDEFVLLLPISRREDAANGPSVQSLALEPRASEVMRRILAAVAQPLVLAEREIRVTCSIGLSVFPQDGEDIDVLLRNADAAMYRAKETGRNRFQFFTAELHERVRKRMELESSLRLALERDEFELHYQPQVSLKTGQVTGVEALLRWRHPEQGLIGPGNFIELAESSGLIVPIGEWVLNRACAQNQAWQNAGLPPVPVAVNVSAKQCAQPNLEARVDRALRASGLAPQWLELELTESVSMADPLKTVELMERLKERGIVLAIDDFGTGYSSMAYLKRFPIGVLKLDMSFVREIVSDPSSLAIAKAVITMAHSLDLQVIAEGVETESQVALLATHGCDQIQGYYFSRPLPADAMAQLLREKRALAPRLLGAAPQDPALLFLDDDPDALHRLESLLRPEGVPLLLARTPAEAFELLARHRVGVVLSDERMPHMRGVEFLSKVRAMYPHAVRLLTSASTDFDMALTAIDRGAIYKFVSKPWNRDELCVLLREAFSAYAPTVRERIRRDVPPNGRWPRKRAIEP